MAQETQRVWLTMSENAGSKPILCELGRKFDLVYSVKTATVTASIGVMGIEIVGEREVIKNAVLWLEQEGVRVEPVELNTIEG